MFHFIREYLFVRKIAKAFRIKAAMDRSESIRMAHIAFEPHRIDMRADPKAYDWSKNGALDMVESEMSYWDNDESAEGAV